MSTGHQRPGSGPVDLSRAVEDLYAAFASYSYRPSMPACAHCVSDDDLDALGRSPLRDLPPQLLGRYTIKAVSTWGEVRDFKWLLPRLADLLAAGLLPVPPVGFTAKLARARWSEWPFAEQEAVRVFLHRWWQVGVCDRSASVVTCRLPALAAAVADLTDALALWHELLLRGGEGRPAALSHLVELVCNSRFRPDLPATLGEVFWEAVGPAASQLSVWLASAELAEVLDRAIYDFATTDDARGLAIAAARIRRYRAALAR